MSLRGRATSPRAAAFLLLLAACGGGDLGSTAPPPPRAGVPLAACPAASDGGCRWYRGRALERFAWAGAAPVVWVAEGRHASYPSREACDRGHHGIDTCDRNALRRPFPVEEGRNVGSEAAPGPAGADGEGCVTGAAVGPRGAVVPDAVECFWSERPFRGWQGRGEGVTPYLRYLRHLATPARGTS